MDKTESVTAVQNMQDYITENLDKEITLSDLAKAANYSQWHSARLFKEFTGKTPFEYIRTLRLTEAAKKLRDTDTKVIDAALDFVFNSQEGFTRAFTREFGLPPYRYKKNPVPLKYFIPYGVKSSYLTFNRGEETMEKKKTQTVFTQVVERPIRKAIIKRGLKAEDYFAYCEEAGCDIWGILESVKEAIYEPAGYWLPQKLIKQGTSKYVQGVEVPFDYKGVIPEGFEIITLEPCKMMVFQGEPFDDNDFEEAIGDIWESIDKYKPELYGYEWANEEAPRFQLSPQGYRGYIEARPVRALTKQGKV